MAKVWGGEAMQHLLTIPLSIVALLSYRKGRYQAVQVRDRPLLAVIALLVARLRGVPFFYWMSYLVSDGHKELARARGLKAGVLKFLVPYLRGELGHFLLYRAVLGRADHVFVQSQSMRRMLCGRRVQDEKMTVVPMGVDLEAIHASGTSGAADPRLEGRRPLVYLGTLDRVRGIELLFEVLALVRARIPNAILVLVGGTDDVLHDRWLRRKAIDAGVDDAVVWTGWLAMDQAWRYVRSAEVALAPMPRSDLLDVSSPTKVIEYLALGVPVVGNDSPEQAEVLQDSGGGLCMPHSAAGFAEGVCTILEMDSESRSKMCVAARQYVARFRDYSVLSEAVARRYRALLAVG